MERSLVRVHVEGDASALVAPLVAGASRVVWAGRPPAELTPRRLRALLGQTVDALVLDLRGEALDLELLAVGEGLVRAGGRVVLVLDPEGPLTGRPPALAVAPFTLDAVGRRAFDRLLAAVPLAPVQLPPVTAAVPTAGNDETRAVVAALARAWAGAEPSRSVLLAARGRGKSSALGLAIAAHAGEVVVSAPNEEALVEVRRFAGRPLRYVPPEALADVRADVVVIDEAAQIPVPMLKAIAEGHPRAHFAWASTDQGYEGTGRGLVLRFLAWAQTRGPLSIHRLEQPIRFAPGDPVEACVQRLFALDAVPAEVPPSPGLDARIEHVPPSRLAADERLLREVVALLAWAHYRTTPGDVVRLLDAPNLRLYVAREGPSVVGVNVVALEGGLDPSAAAHATRVRLRGQSLADTLATHSGHPEAATFALRRSVRIATHPERRRAGLARALTEHVHRVEEAELFGTLFGATAELIRFRRALGYEVVRLGASRGARSGEPSVVMLRPVSARAHALVSALRRELSVNLEPQLALLAHEGAVSDELAAALFEGLPAPSPPPDAELAERLSAYLGSAQPIEACIGFVAAHAGRHAARLEALAPADRALIEGRVLGLRAWPEVAAHAGLPIEEAHRRMRGAVRRLVS